MQLQDIGNKETRNRCTALHYSGFYLVALVVLRYITIYYFIISSQPIVYIQTLPLDNPDV